MNKMFNLMIAGCFVVGASTGIAASKTEMNAHWICTTNASSSSVEAEKAADDKMAKTAASAAAAFAFATENCRDCTEITCKAQDK